jgi:hypothetical protein
MKMSITRGNEQATYNEQTGLFVGSKELTEFLNTYVSVFGDVGNNPFERLLTQTEGFNLTITKYEPDVYPKGTLDV